MKNFLFFAKVRKVDGGFLTHTVKVAWEFELETTSLQVKSLFHRIRPHWLAATTVETTNKIL